MATLTDLPQELRQRILLTAVQQEDRLAGSKWPKTIIALLHVCKTLRRDMPWVLDQWTPVLHLHRPSDLTAPSLSIDGVACGPFRTKPADTLCIHLFYDTSATIIRKATFNPPDGLELHQALVAAWRDAVPRLPVEKGVVLLDATPAPGWLRENYVFMLDALLAAGGQAFLAYHTNGIVDFVRCIYQHYAGNVEVAMTGRYDMLHNQAVPRICYLLRQLGIRIRQPQKGEMTFTKALQVRQKLIFYAVYNLTPMEGTPEVEDWSQAKRLAPLRKVRWLKDTAGLFPDLLRLVGMNTLTDDVRKLAEVMVDEHGSTVTITEWAQLYHTRRRLIRCLARDMGLRVKTEGKGENRYVVISKKESV